MGKPSGSWQTNKETVRITVKEVEYAAFSLARKLMPYDEPIPDFGTRFPKILESCIETPHVTYSKKNLYPRFVDKASILFYLMIKNHPFQNGNKRIAIMSLLYFLYKNGKWLEISNNELYRVAKDVAESTPEDRQRILRSLQKLLQKYGIGFERENL